MTGFCQSGGFVQDGMFSSARSIFLALPLWCLWWAISWN